MSTHPLIEQLHACVLNANGDAKELLELARSFELASQALTHYADAGSYRLEGEIALASKMEALAESCLDTSAQRLNRLSCVQGVFEEED